MSAVFTIVPEASGRESVIFDSGLCLRNVHPGAECVGEYCVIHRPSNHHMSEWPMHWLDGARMFVRICPCGIAHPDPDQLPYLQATSWLGEAGVHPCCGCCFEGGQRWSD